MLTFFADLSASAPGQDGDTYEGSVMPNWDKVSHISFSTPNKAACVAWFERALEFKPFEDVEGEGWSGVMMMHAPSATVIEFQQHDRNKGEAFDPRRTGLDHIGFKVGSREELENWQRHFQSLDVDCTPIVDREYGSVLTFRDPDMRQFEMFYREGHP
jgi:glyoxylase I family protein